MNSYERIQAAIDFIEDHLTSRIDLQNLAAIACFSTAHFYRMFYALTGHSVKEYIRKRRLHEAAVRLTGSNERLIDICFDYRFEYQESFTRAFKAMFGETPGMFRKQKRPFGKFLRLDLREKYFLPGEINTLDPRIKVLRRLAPMRVASCRAVGPSPEREARSKLWEWARRRRLINGSAPIRLFGFDNPGPSPDSPVYGYEFWMTVGPEITGGNGIAIRNFPGGFYAVTGTTVTKINAAWKHFVRWLEISKYKPGTHQCLEEHLSPIDTPDYNMQIDLYLPLAEQ